MSGEELKSIRVWKELNVKDVEKHLVVVGELSSECFSCHEIGLGLDVKICPKCGIYFKYMGFRRKNPVSYLQRIKNNFPGIVFIDFEDFKKIIGKRDAHKLFNAE